MAATGEVDLYLAYSNCMEFCQALATQGKTFHFSLNMGTNFSFSFSKKEGKPLNAEENGIPQQEDASPFHCGLLSGCWLLILL